LTPYYVLDTAQKTIDNSLDSDIIVSIRIVSIRNRTSRLISRWVVKCVRQKVAGAFAVKGDNFREEGVMLMANQGQPLCCGWLRVGFFR